MRGLKGNGGPYRDWYGPKFFSVFRFLFFFIACRFIRGILQITIIVFVLMFMSLCIHFLIAPVVIL